ncbi:MAG: DNA topoisomerase 3 [Lachnospiraceae bacterium]|nr:DNA topoisomerase 3 [Lachnospiraceae bacterium]
MGFTKKDSKSSEGQNRKSLVLAEKPSVGRLYAGALDCNEKHNGFLEGKNYIVSWCIGHLIQKAPPDAYEERYKSWKTEDLPIIPEEWKHRIIPGTKDQFRIVKELMKRKDVEEIIIATDCGREGEAIARLVYMMAGCRKPLLRFWTNSMEESAIIEGFRNLRPGKEFEHLYEAAECRARADWLVGMNLTRLYTLKYGNGKPLNVGRVKSPTLSLIVQREAQIRDFVKEPYFIAHIVAKGMDAISEHISDRYKAQRIAEDCWNRQAYVEKIERERKKTNPPSLYDLTTLQRDANRCYSLSAKDTLNIVQQLYEKRLVTYPRTDSKYLSDDMGDTAAKVYMAIQKCKYQDMQELNTSVSPDIERLLNSKKVTDHHAIIPTVEIEKPGSLDGLNQLEQKILQLIINRFLCAVDQAHIYESVRVLLDCNGHKFKACGKSVLQPGWKRQNERFMKTVCKRFVPEKSDGEEQDGPDPLCKIPRDLTENVAVRVDETRVSEHETKPPAHLTEDTLLSLMEKAGVEELSEDAERSGLGTTATRAEIIESLIKGGFVERRKKQLFPTETGEYLCRILPEKITSVQMTSQWENRLAAISQGKETQENFMKDIQRFVEELISAEK